MQYTRSRQPVRPEFSQSAAHPGADQGNRGSDRPGEQRASSSQLESDYSEAQQKEELIRQALDQQKAETNDMSEKMVQYNILKREAEANKALYEGLLTKLKEAGISEGLRSSNIRMVDPAMIPSYPSRPAKARNIALAFLVGLVGGIGLALFREYLDNTVKTPDDVEMLARLPSLCGRTRFRRRRWLEGTDGIFWWRFHQWPREAH